MNKQTRDGIILGAALLALVIVGYFSLRGMQGDQPAPPPPRATSATVTSTPDVPVATEKPAETADPGVVPWIDSKRLPNIVAEVKEGRNPFMDLTLPKQAAPAPLAPTPPPPEKQKEAQPQPQPQPQQPPEQDINNPMTLIKTLNWITPAELAAEFKKEKLDVDLKTTDRPGQVKLVGYAPDYDRAVQIINTRDRAPEIPKFVLSGVIATPTQRLAVVLLDGKQYSLMEGESIPELGWVVTKITPTGVNLTKGKLSTKLRLSGGSPS